MTYTLCKKGGKKRTQQMANSKEEIFRREFEQAISESHQQAAAVPVKKVKRFRSAFTTEQINYLENEFRLYPYIGNARRKDVANILDISERAIKIWFQNRRMKEKKDITNKESDVQEQKQVKTEIANHNLNNINDLLSTNDQQSLPKLPVSDESKMVTKIDKETSNKIKLKGQVLQTFGNKSFIDESVNRGLTSMSKTAQSANVAQNDTTTVSKSSAEFSIELYKKYKSETDGNENKNEEEVISVNEKSNSLNNSIKTECGEPHFVPYLPNSAIPQDLSSPSNSNVSQLEPRVCNESKPIKTSPQQRNPDVVNNSSDIPFYLKGVYAQPFIPPGNMIWKPINVAPIMSTSMSAMPIPGNSSEPISPVPQKHSPKVKCNCDCHLKPCSTSPIVFQQSSSNPPVQYVITAVPFQNPPP